jgi:hypothetical protein
MMQNSNSTLFQKLASPVLVYSSCWFVYEARRWKAGIHFLEMSEIAGKTPQGYHTY